MEEINISVWEKRNPKENFTLFYQTTEYSRITLHACELTDSPNTCNYMLDSICTVILTPLRRGSKKCALSLSDIKQHHVMDI